MSGFEKDLVRQEEPSSRRRPSLLRPPRRPSPVARKFTDSISCDLRTMQKFSILKLFVKLFESGSVHVFGFSSLLEIRSTKRIPLCFWNGLLSVDGGK